MMMVMMTRMMKIVRMDSDKDEKDDVDDTDFDEHTLTLATDSHPLIESRETEHQPGLFQLQTLADPCLHANGSELPPRSHNHLAKQDKTRFSSQWLVLKS